MNYFQKNDVVKQMNKSMKMMKMIGQDIKHLEPKLTGPLTVNLDFDVNGVNIAEVAVVVAVVVVVVVVAVVVVVVADAGVDADVNDAHYGCDFGGDGDGAYQSYYQIWK